MNKLTVAKGIQASKSLHWKVGPPCTSQFSRGFAGRRWVICTKNVKKIKHC